MSIIRAIKAQFGLSNTPANNFTLDASADNGTLKLARGNAGATTQDILTVDANGNVTIPKLNAQTWQDVKASRVIGNTYTNTTDKPIEVAVSATSTLVSLLALYVNGVLVYYGTWAAAGSTFSIYGKVPAGATYSIANFAGTPTTSYWAELR